MTNLKTILVAGIVGGLVMTSGLVKADQVIFSQYDGVNTWNNVYVEVDNALDFVKPGVGFAEAFAGSESAGVEAVAGVEGVARVDRLVRFNYKLGTSVYRTSYRFKENLNGKAKFKQRSQYGNYTSRVTEAWMDNNISSAKGSPNFTQLKHTDRAAVEKVDAVAEVKEVKPSWEQSLPARAIVAVDTGVDMEAFIKDFMSK